MPQNAILHRRNSRPCIKLISSRLEPFIWSRWPLDLGCHDGQEAAWSLLHAGCFVLESRVTVWVASGEVGFTVGEEHPFFSGRPTECYFRVIAITCYSCTFCSRPSLSILRLRSRTGRSSVSSKLPQIVLFLNPNLTQSPKCNCRSFSLHFLSLPPPSLHISLHNFALVNPTVLAF